MSLPFFSVVIPTKNRSFILAQAIRSVLAQTFSDYELLIVDNDDDQAATHNVVSEYPDPRIRYFRTGDLSMPDNWEYGFTEARGEYVLMLQDKSVLKFHSLKRIRDVVSSQQCEVVSWLQDIFNDLNSPPTIIREPGSGAVRRFPSEKVLDTFLSGTRHEAARVLPRGLNSCIHRSLIETIRRGPAGRLFLPNSPDYTFSFLQLRHAQNIHHIDEALTIYGSCRHGQGRKTIYKEQTAEDLIKDFGHIEEDLFNLAPIKARLLTSVIYNDYLNVTKLANGRLTQHPLDRRNYFLEAHDDLQNGRHLGLDMSIETSAWESALASQSTDVRQAVEDVVRPRPAPLLKRVARALGLHRVRNRLRSLLNRKKRHLPLFATALEFAEWESAQRPENASPQSL